MRASLSLESLANESPGFFTYSGRTDAQHIPTLGLNLFSQNFYFFLKNEFKELLKLSLLLSHQYLLCLLNFRVT